MAVVSDNGSAAKHRIHVDHRILSDFRSDVENGSHHNNGVVLDVDHLADNRARFNAGMRKPQIEKGNRRIAGGSFDPGIFNFIFVFF